MRTAKAQPTTKKMRKKGKLSSKSNENLHVKEMRIVHRRGLEYDTAAASWRLLPFEINNIHTRYEHSSYICAIKPKTTGGNYVHNFV